MVAQPHPCPSPIQDYHRPGRSRVRMAGGRIETPTEATPEVLAIRRCFASFNSTGGLGFSSYPR